MTNKQLKIKVFILTPKGIGYSDDFDPSLFKAKLTKKAADEFLRHNPNYRCIKVLADKSLIEDIGDKDGDT